MQLTTVITLMIPDLRTRNIHNILTLVSGESDLHKLSIPFTRLVLVRVFIYFCNTASGRLRIANINFVDYFITVIIIV